MIIIISLGVLVYFLISFASWEFGFTEYVPLFIGHADGESMHPTLSFGDFILISPHVKFDDVKDGDIIIFDNGEKHVVHRVIGFQDGALITQGDNNKYPDNTYTTKETYVGSVIYVFGGGVYMILLFLGFLICMLVYDLINNWK